MQATNAALEYEVLPLAAIDPSATNPRKRFTAMEDLAASIRMHGVIQPILVRPAGPRYELVAGERRWRASEMAGRETIPAVVRELTDEEVIELQAIENGQREDVHAVEEASSYQALRELGRSVDWIAERVGKSKAHVYARLKLGDLVEEAREACLDGLLPPDGAVLVARLPPAAQDEVLKVILPRGDGEDFEPWTVRDIANHIANRFTISLARAPFNIDDGKLLVEAGTCTECPKRGGNMTGPKLRADVCTDPGCFQQKVDCHWQRLVREADAGAYQVLDDAEATRLFALGEAIRPDGKWVDLDGVRSMRDGNVWRNVSIRELLGKDAMVEAIVRSPKGDVVELASRNRVEKAAALWAARSPAPDAGKNGKGKKNSHANGAAAAAARPDVEERMRRSRAISDRMLQRLGELAATQPAKLLRLVAEVQREEFAVDRHFLEDVQKVDFEELLARMVISLVFFDEVVSGGEPADRVTRDVFTLAGLHPKQLIAELEAGSRAAKPKAEKVPKTSVKKAPPKQTKKAATAKPKKPPAKKAGAKKGR